MVNFVDRSICDCSCVPAVASDQRSSADRLNSPPGRRGIEAVGKVSGKMKMQMKRMKHVTWFDNFCICSKNDVHSGKDIASLFSYQSINLSSGKVKSLFFLFKIILYYI